jgi:hypothetical protein
MITPPDASKSLPQMGLSPKRRDCESSSWPLLKFSVHTAMPRGTFIREKFTKERTAAEKLAAEYFERFSKDRYQAEVESWRELQSQNIEFTMKRLREPIEGDV